MLELVITLAFKPLQLLTRPCRYIGSTTVIVTKALSLSILLWPSCGDWSLPEKGGTSRTRFFLVWGSGKFILLECSDMVRLWRRQPSISFPLFVADRRSGYVSVLVWLLLWTLVYFLFFFPFGTHGRLSSDCLLYIHDGWWVDCLLPFH